MTTNGVPLDRPAAAAVPGLARTQKRLLVDLVRGCKVPDPAAEQSRPRTEPVALIREAERQEDPDPCTQPQQPKRNLRRGRLRITVRTAIKSAAYGGTFTAAAGGIAICAGNLPAGLLVFAVIAIILRLFGRRLFKA